MNEIKKQSKLIERLAKWVVVNLNKKFFEKIDVITPFQKEAIETTELIIKDKDSDIQWAPNDCRFILNGKNSIKVFSDNINITYFSEKGSSHFEVKISEYRYKKLVTLIDNEIQKRMNSLEEEKITIVASKLSEMKQELINKLNINS